MSKIRKITIRTCLVLIILCRSRFTKLKKPIVRLLQIKYQSMSEKYGLVQMTIKTPATNLYSIPSRPKRFNPFRFRPVLANAVFGVNFQYLYNRLAESIPIK